jgi:hypothetical protein
MNIPTMEINKMPHTIKISVAKSVGIYSPAYVLTSLMLGHTTVMYQSPPADLRPRRSGWPVTVSKQSCGNAAPHSCRQRRHIDLIGPQ